MESRPPATAAILSPATAGITTVAILVAVALVRASSSPVQTAPSQSRPAAAQTPIRPEVPTRLDAPAGIVGDYMGVLTPPSASTQLLYTRLHIRTAAGGGFSGTLESPEQGDTFPLTDVRVDGQRVSFTLSFRGGSMGWKGTIENDGRLNGVLAFEKDSATLVFTRETARAQIPAAAAQTPTRAEPTPNLVSAADTPRWEVVSVRPCPPAQSGGGERGRGGGPGSGGGPYRFSPDRMILNCLTVRSLIRSAYHVYLDAPGQGRKPMDDVLIKGLGVYAGRRDPMDGTDGGPDWLDTDLYTIEAKSERAADRALMQGPMLQAILESRFKLRLHRESRETAVDAVVIGNGGPKLKPFVEGSCVRHPQVYHSPNPPSPFARSQQRQPRYCRIDGGRRT